ncbi:MAG: ESPR-type extended signal peptide-containing protein [Veillonella sp.]|uniref:ESPR-type extended signal peptide-containing protein n=1 Tax=Veillonella sp. TaxID=1926307 RepID=UPI0029055B9A|nr:ESPR-type extended signal peptide-containing protein [Veillonella sp.]MDU2702079.1 ESPR-type extended signal peptide-containing protein [Veillonella sp.]
MNKIFKVVWSKTKECYVVVSEVAKNNGGKKKVLASVLAGLAMVGAGATVTSVQAADMNSDQSANTKNQINIWANTLTKGNPAAGGSGASGSGVANANDVKPSQYGDEISIAIGGQNSINTTDTTSPNSGGSGYAIGNKNKIKGNRNVALGTENKTYGDDSIAIGNKTVSGTGHGIAIGSINGTTQTVAYGSANPSETAQSAFGFALAIGSGAQADGRANGASGGIAIGQMVKSTNNNTVAIGVNTTASGNNAVAIGSGAQATQRISTAYGPNANANSAGGVAIGTDAVVGTDTGLTTVIAGATAVGANAQAQSTSGSAFGRNAKADKNAENATALGAYATANIAGGVALGSNSVTTTAAGVPGYNPANGRTNKYSDQSGAIGTSTLAAVSVGNGLTATRQITGLAAGTADTDAVNVAQLKNVNLKYAGDSTQVTGSTDVRLNDGTFNVNGDGTIISTEATATGIKVTAKVGGTINANTDGKVVAPATNGIATTTNVTDAINKSGWNIVSSNNGGSVTGTQATKLVNPGSTVTLSAGKNIVLDQNDKKFTYSLSDTVALTNAGSLTVGDTKVNNGGVTITAPTGGTTTDVKLTNTGLDNGGNKIVNVKDGDVSATSKDAVNGSQLHAVAAKERHIAPTTATHAAYTVDNNGDVTLDYVDGDGAATSEKAVIKGVAKQDLSNITNAGKQVITGLSNKVVAGDNITVDETEDATTKQKTYKVNAKLAKLEDGTNTTVTGDGTTGNAYHVNVAGDLTGISSITNGGTNNGKISFGPNKTVTVDGDHSITLNASTGTIGGLQNKTFDPTNITSGQAATEDQLKSVHDTLKASELHIAPTASTLTNEHLGGTASGNTATGAAAQAYKYDATTKQVVLEYNDGNGTNKTGTKAVIDFSALNTGTGASSWNIASDKVSTTEGTVAAGSGATQNIADGKTVTMKAGKNLTVKQENVGGNASVAFSLDKDLKDLDSVTTNKTITKEITLKDPNGGTTSTTIKKDGDRITYTNDGSTTVNKVANLADEKHITPGTYSVDSNGKVTMTYTDGNNTLVPNTTTVIDGLVTKKLDNIDNDGKKTITGLGTIVKAGNNVTVSEASDATTGQKTYTVNAVTPAVYTKADGTKVVKRSDGTYTTNIDGSAGNDVPASDVIISFQDAAGDTKNATSIVNNVGSAIKNQTGGDFLTKLDNANTATPNAAVNVSDLKNTADGLTNKGLKFDANSGGVKTNKLGSTVKVQGAGTSADANYSGANIKTFIDQDTTGNTTIDVKLDKNLTGINSISNTTTGPKMEFGGNSINITGGSLNMGGSNITNLKSGIVNNNATDDTNAANIGDVKKIAKDSDLHIAPTAGTTNNVAEYTVDANNKVTLTYQDGNGTAVTAPKAVIDLSALANKITSGYTFNANATANGGTVANDSTTPAAVTAVANGGTINYAAGKNLTVKQDIDTTNKTHTYTYSLDKDINVETVTVTGQNGKDGKIGINGKNGTNGVNGTNRVDIQVEKGVDGIDGKNGTDGISRIVYEDKTGTHTVATMDDGLKFTGNNTVIENKQKLGSLVKVQGEGTKEGTTVINPTTGEKELVLSDSTTKFESAKDNIAVVADGADTLTVKLNKKLKGLDSVQTKTVELGDHTTPGGTTNITYNTGDNRIEYTTPGTTDTKKVATTDDIWTIQGNGTDVKPVNGKVNVKAGENILITTPTTADGSMTINAVTPAVYTDKNGNKLTKDKDGKFHKPDGTEVAATDVITSIQDASGNVTGGNSIVNNVGSAIKGLGSTGDNYLTKLDLANTATPNAAVNVSDLKSTADALESNELHIRPTTSGRTGETVNKNTAGTAESYKYDAATKSVTLKYNDGTGAGVTGTEAKIDLSGLADQITSGYTFSTNAKGNLADGTTATATAVGNGKTVSFAAGKNLTVEQNINATTGEHTYTYALSDKITAGKDGVNGKDGSVGVTGKDGSSVVINGADGSIGMTGPKGQDGKDGINGRDGANLSMTSAKGEQVLVNRDPDHNADTDKAERIVYVPKDASGNPIQDANGKNIVREVATMDDGLKFTGNNESTENKHKLGSLVKVQGEGVTENTTTNKLEANGEEFKSASGNIAVVADSIDKLTVKLNKNLAGINKISNGGSSITLNDNPSTTTPAVTITGGNLSMGDNTTKNKIVNLAPGTDDNDAVNVKQLKDAKTVLADGKNTKKSGTGTATDPYKVNVEGDLTDITSITNKADASGNAGKITFSPNQTVTVDGDHSITLNASTGKIGGLQNKTFDPTNFTSGQAATEDQLKSVHDTLKASERHIAPTTVAAGSTENKGGTANAAGTANVYKYDAASKTVTLTYNDGNGNAVTDTKAVIDLSNLSTGGTGASSWNVKSSANTTDGGAVDANHNANAQNIADGKSVEFQAGKNLVVKQTNDTTNGNATGNATVEFSLSDNITVGKDGANGKDGSVGAKGADGSAVVMNGKDGSIGLNGTNGANGISIKGKDGANGVGIDGKDGVTRIVYTEKVPDPANPGTTKEVTHEVATMDDGLKFTGNNTGTVNKHKLGSLVKVQGEGVSATDEAAFVSASGNIAVTAENNDTLTIRLNKNLKGLNSIQLGGNTIQSNGDNITFTTNGGTTKTVATTDQLWTIQANGTDVPAKSGKVNLVAGDHIAITPDAANGKMTISATGFGSMDGFNVKTSADANGTHAGDTTENIKNGKTVDMQAGKNLVVTQTNDRSGNTTVNYALNKDVDLGTNGSLKTGDTTINNDGFKNGNTTVGGNGMTIKDPTDPTKTVSLTKDGLNNGGNQITNVASGGNVDTNAANIGDIKRLAKDTRIKDGTYTVDNNGTVELTYVDGNGNQVKDASGNAITAKITGLTTLDSTRVNVAVNETGSGKAVGSKAAVKVTKGTEFVAGDNLIVERKARTGNDLDNSVVYSLNSNLTGINSISNTSTGPKMTFGGNSINVTNGDLNMGGNKITNLGKGTATTDAATVGQLTKVTSNNHSVVINKTTDANGAPVYDLAVTGTPGAPAVDPRIDQLGEEIGRVGAQGAALSALKPIQYDPLEPTQIMAGYGNYRGNSAVALGVAHYKNESTLIHGGVSWAGGSSHMMANAGVTWKVGNRDSEAAVADRYRKGPISSAYAMQQEMAAMKAQNAGLKGEVSDLKAENEQMKAQIAAMMAKLGL